MVCARMGHFCKSCGNPAQVTWEGDGTTDAPATVMADKQPTESQLIPLHIVMWTTFTVGLIMVMVVVLMH